MELTAGQARKLRELRSNYCNSLDFSGEDAKFDDIILHLISEDYVEKMLEVSLSSEEDAVFQKNEKYYM